MRVRITWWPAADAYSRLYKDKFLLFGFNSKRVTDCWTDTELDENVYELNVTKGQCHWIIRRLGALSFALKMQLSIAYNVLSFLKVPIEDARKVEAFLASDMFNIEFLDGDA